MVNCNSCSKMLVGMQKDLCYACDKKYGSIEKFGKHNLNSNSTSKNSDRKQINIPPPHSVFEYLKFIIKYINYEQPYKKKAYDDYKYYFYALIVTWFVGFAFGFLPWWLNGIDVLIWLLIILSVLVDYKYLKSQSLDIVLIEWTKNIKLGVNFFYITLIIFSIYTF